jgi:hypothetical protein
VFWLPVDQPTAAAPLDHPRRNAAAGTAGAYFHCASTVESDTTDVTATQSSRCSVQSSSRSRGPGAADFSRLVPCAGTRAAAGATSVSKPTGRSLITQYVH